MNRVATAVAYNPGKQKFLLLYRSEEREVNPGVWEFPSGRTEDEDPREAALRELEEETGFMGEVVRSGEPFEVETEDGDFRVHPFLVVVKGRSPRLSEEHTRWKWVYAEEISELETIPGIEKDIQTVGISLDGVE